MSDATRDLRPGRSPAAAKALDELWKMVGACMQCGTCTASCPNAFAMDHTPRQMWRMIQLGLLQEVLASRTFWLCSSCYSCTMRCPRGLSLTATMAALKRLAGALDEPPLRKRSAFYRAFVDNIHAFGRVQETNLMLRYFWAMKDPLLPLGYTPLGLKLLQKGKLHPAQGGQKGKLDALFDKVGQMEAKP